MELAPLETLNKDLYPWFFDRLVGPDIFAFAHTNKYAYRAFLKYLNDCMNSMSMGIGFDLLVCLYYDNTKSRLLEGIFRRMSSEMREKAWQLVYRSLAQNNVRVLLRWVDPNILNMGALKFACNRGCVDTLRVLLDDPRLLTYNDALYDVEYRAGKHPGSYGDIMRMLLRDKRFQKPFHAAINFALSYGDIVAIKMMIGKAKALPMRHSLYQRACSENKTEFIKIMIPYVSIESIRSVLNTTITKPVRAMLLLELSNRMHV